MTLTILELDDDLLADEGLEERVEEHGCLPRACPLPVELLLLLLSRARALLLRWMRVERSRFGRRLRCE